MDEDRLVIRPKSAKGEDGHKVFSVRLRDDMMAQLDVLIQETGYCRNELITKLLEYALQRCVVEKNTESKEK